MKIRISKGAKICKICRRGKSKAILEQKVNKKTCDLTSDLKCDFEDEIKSALKRSSFKIKKQN